MHANRQRMESTDIRPRKHALAATTECQTCPEQLNTSASSRLQFKGFIKVFKAFKVTA